MYTYLYKSHSLITGLMYIEPFASGDDDLLPIRLVVLVSVVMLAYTKNTRIWINSIKKHTPKVPYNLLVYNADVVQHILI